MKRKFDYLILKGRIFYILRNILLSMKENDPSLMTSRIHAFSSNLKMFLCCIGSFNNKTYFALNYVN